MIEKLKKSTLKRSIVWSVVILIIGLALTIGFAADSFHSIFGYVDFGTLEPDEIKNQLVEVDVDLSYGCFMEEYSENTTTHRRTTTDLYYVMLSGNANSLECRYMTIKVPVSSKSKMEALTEDTYNEVMSDPIHFVGKLRKLDKEEYGYFEEFFTSAGWTKSDIEEATLPYYIDVFGTEFSYGYGLGYLFAFVGGVLLLVWGIVRIVKASKGGNMKKFFQDINGAGYTESVIESDMNSATPYTKNGYIRVGRLCVYFNLNTTTPRAIPVNKIQWAYQNTTTHRTNGIKTGVTYSVMIYADGYKNSFSLPVTSEAMCQDILKKMDAMFPWIVIGYSPELAGLYTKNRAEFLELRYNKVDHMAVEPGFEGFNNSYTTPEA